VGKSHHYSLEAAERARTLFARPEAINHYWQSLELMERLPQTPERSLVHYDVIVSLVQLPGWMRDEEAGACLFRHVDQALVNATADGRIADMARLETLKGRHQYDEALLQSALVRAEGSGDSSAEAYSASSYGYYLGQRGRFEASLHHVARAIEIFGTQGDLLGQAQAMTGGGRCLNARAGKLDQAFDFAAGAHELAIALNSAELRAWCAMEAEPYYYKGLWDEAVQTAENWLPVAWAIREWNVVFFASAWLALASLKVNQADKAWRVLERVANEAPARLHKASGFAIPYAQIALAQVRLARGHQNEALSTVRQALDAALRGGYRLEEVAANRVLGQIHEAMGDQTEADAAPSGAALACARKCNVLPNSRKRCWPMVVSAGALMRRRTER
jgi:tetratricopeptide (TPR) repeat protein